MNTRCRLSNLAIPALLFFVVPMFAAGAAWGAISIDANVVKNQGTASTTVRTASFSTIAGNELLLAFIASDGVSSPNTTVMTVTGAGLTWALVQRTNAQLGTSEIWRAFSASPLTNVTVTATLTQRVASSMTVISFTGVNTSGTNGLGAIGAVGSGNASSGAPTATLVTMGNGSLVLGVGNDWDNAISRTPGTGQTVVHQYLAPVGDTYWVQMQSNPILLSGTSVTINDTSPTGDRYNLSIVEVLAAAGGGTTGTITGTISQTGTISGATVQLLQGSTQIATAVVGTNGSYTFSSVANGTYTLQPLEAGFTFSPATQSAIVNGNTVTVPAFTATATTGTINGSISQTGTITGATVQLLQGATLIATATVGTNGSYTFSSVANGVYTLQPVEAGFTFSPATQNATVNGNTVTVLVFTATATTGSINGSISQTGTITGATVQLLQGATLIATATVGTNGSYTFSSVANGVYTLQPSEAGFTFAPATQNVTVNGNVVAAQTFTATAAGAGWSLSGVISPSLIGTDAVVTLSGAGGGTATADAGGNYSFANLANGIYTLTPSKAGTVFTPLYQSATINGANVNASLFTAESVNGQIKYPDLSDIIPTGAISIVGTGSSALFQYTHDTYNGGPGPLVILPVYNPASGTYQGTQNIYSLNSSGTWTLTQSIRIPGSFVFDAAHGHFHFPFTTYGLYTVAADGTPGTPVATSGKISFCINDSFIYNSSLPNAGALGNLGSCSDPTSLRGLDIGAVDEYDQTDEGQSISIAGVPDGTYWLRAIVDPDNYLTENDKTNNETDVKVSISGGTVTVLQTVVPVLLAPPVISVTSPLDGATVTGTVQLTASTATATGVQLLIDGEPLGSFISAVPYTMSWDTGTSTNGTHWLAAQTTGPTGRIGTSAVVAVTVSNSTTAPPSVQITTPNAGSTVSAAVTVAANAASSQGIASVTFYVDGAQIGTPITAPPFLTTWDTETSTAGQHTLTATAIDITGNSGTSAPVAVTVDNSHPANLIGMDATVSVDGAGAMTAPVITTSQNGELLVAFVAYDGPLGSPQTAAVSSAGLIWRLVKRSNHQAGTAEIWMAYASDSPETFSVTAQPGVGTSFHGSLTVIAFTNASGPGIVNQTSAPSGAPDIYLPGVSAGNWVFAVGNDWDNDIARTLVSGQVLVHQRVDAAVGDTYWVQSTAAPSTATGLVDIHDSAPTGDQWNYAAVEIVATRN